MLYAAVVELDVVGPVPLADHDRRRSFGMVVEPKVRRQESTELLYVVEYVFDKARYRPVVWRGIDMATGNNHLVGRVDLVELVVLVTFGCSLRAEKEGEDGSVAQPCQLTH